MVGPRKPLRWLQQTLPAVVPCDVLYNRVVMTAGQCVHLSSDRCLCIYIFVFGYAGKWPFLAFPLSFSSEDVESVFISSLWFMKLWTVLHYDKRFSDWMRKCKRQWINSYVCRWKIFFLKEFMHQWIISGHALNTSVSMLKKAKPLSINQL